MAGVSGGNLAQRVHAIAAAPHIDDLHGAKKTVLALAGALTLALPLAGGLLTAPLIAPLGEPVRRQIAAVQMHASQALERGVAVMAEQLAMVPVPSRGAPPRITLAAIAPVAAEPPSFTIAPEERAVTANMPAQPAAPVAETAATPVTVMDGEPDGRGEADHITCRAPQVLTGSRLRGPRICRTNREWAQMTRNGRMFAPDGSVETAASRRCIAGGISVSGKQYQGSGFAPSQVSSFVYCR
jgi:hypothetical protein